MVDLNPMRVGNGGVTMRNAAKKEPIPSEGTVNILPLVVADLHAREKVGIVKYGTPLQANNGRDALMDAYQEALDLCMYLRQAICERYCQPGYLHKDGLMYLEPEQEKPSGPQPIFEMDGYGAQRFVGFKEE